MALNELQQQAAAAYPEVEKVLALQARDGGWQFFFIVSVLVGVRKWPGGWTDHFHLRTDTDCWAARTTHDEELVWEHSGGLDNVIQALFELPAPDQPRAPTLVQGRGRSLRLILGGLSVRA
jgi:hypothetical protein